MKDNIPQSSIQDADMTLQKPHWLHDSGRNSPVTLDGFHQLIESINQILGPSNGIDSADVDVEELKKVMFEYTSREEEWQRYAFEDYSRPYTRNLVDHGNGKANLLVLVWTPGKASPIHDHANAHCVMKILKGTLVETIYNWPCQSPDGPSKCATSASSIYPSPQHTCSQSSGGYRPHELTARKSTTFQREGVTYMSDRLGLHRIANPSQEEVAVSLHLYTPPNAAKHGCHIFDERTGKKVHATQCNFYSELGTKL